MRTHRFASHTAEEKRRLSNLGHLIEGLLLATVGILAILGNVGIATWASTAWPVLILVVGVLLLVLIYPRHPLSDWPAIWRDPQQRQHTIMAAAIAVAGAAELLRGSNAAWAYVWPGVTLLIGALFVTHTQHGTGEAMTSAVRQHHILGVTLIGAGLLRLVEIIAGAGALAIVWPLALLAAAAQLIIYREPEGAYETEAGHAGHG